ncbi:alpha/beta fold hydrolase [uncultured Dokdonia sp.]|uniref:alpha/beta hydrolase n=1 Tax=uncultured Dokdonia sp. TaxID=575653 RepID=UPI00262A699D|nr:alpha/beta fold hydrolase [uncultured Dokdonia sp.]
MKTTLKITLIVCALISIACKKEITPTTATEKTVILKDTLIQHTVISEGHPMAVWEKKAPKPKGVILFVHGRTWSGVPDFDLQVEDEDLSLMDGMIEQGYTTYAIDLRGYGATPRDASEWNTPNKAARDINTVLQWISTQHKNQKVHLFGWSMGSTLSLLATQKDDTHIASLTLFGFWLDINTIIPEDPTDIMLEKRVNTAKAAASDFIIPGSISKNAVDTYVKMALEADPIRVDWKQQNEYNQIDPTVINTPVLVLQGAEDPIGPTNKQATLFTQLKTKDKSWVVISGGDHAAFMETPRPHFIKSFADFIDRFNP